MATGVNANNPVNPANPPMNQVEMKRNNSEDKQIIFGQPSTQPTLQHQQTVEVPGYDVRCKKNFTLN